MAPGAALRLGDPVAVGADGEAPEAEDAAAVAGDDAVAAVAGVAGTVAAADADGEDDALVVAGPPLPCGAGGAAA